VNVTNTAPALAQSLPPLPGVTEGGVFDYSFPRELFVDADADTITYSVTTVPTAAWLAFSPLLRVISGTPTSSDVGMYVVTVEARDAFGGVGGVSGSLTVNANPVVNVSGVWATAASPIVVPGVRATVNVSVPRLFSDPEGDPVTYSVWDGSQAPWVSIVNSGDRGSRWLVGVPDKNSHTLLSVSVVGRDGRGGVSSAVTLVLTIANSAPTVGSSGGLPLQSVSVGSVQIVAVPNTAFSDADGDALTYSVARVDGSGNSSGSVVTFVSVSGSSVVIGPRMGQQGSYLLQLSAFDGHGGNASSEFTVNVPNRAPVRPSRPRRQSSGNVDVHD
jgi:hypothetical protein